MGNVTLQFARGDLSVYLEKNIQSLKERVYNNFKETDDDLETAKADTLQTISEFLNKE